MQQICLNGDNAFYKQSNYQVQLDRDCRSDRALSNISYSYQKTQTVAEKIFSYVSFPLLSPYKVAHWIAGKIIVPASLNSYATATKARMSECDEKAWKYQRVSIGVNGSRVDAMLIVKEATAGNGKWVLHSNGNAELYEDNKADDTDVKNLLSALDANALVFNYPGVGASEGWFPTREAISETYEAMFRFLEDGTKGIGATTIIAHGLSLGGGAQAGIESHKFQSHIKYVFIKDRTFSNLSKAATGIFAQLHKIIGNLMGGLVKLFDWNMDPLSSSKKLRAHHEIILQTARFVSDAEELADSKLLAPTDLLITKEASLAFGLFEDCDESLLENKTIFGIPELHNFPLRSKTLKLVAKKINEVS